MGETWPIWRSMLFVPAHRAAFVAKAHTRGADACVLDLEDSVPEGNKDDARSRVQEGSLQITQAGSTALVRINDSWEASARDLEAAVCRQVSAVVLPKAKDKEHVCAVDRRIAELESRRNLQPGHTLLIAQIEDVVALPKMDQIATSSPRLMGMTLGSEDFCASAGMEPTVETLFAPNQQLVFACRRAGILPLGFPGSIADYSDLAAFRRAVRLARQLGFVGGFCIHPSQVAVMNEEFAPSDEEMTHAIELIAAYESCVRAGQGAVEYKGKMIDLPVVERARQLLLRARAHRNVRSLDKA